MVALMLREGTHKYEAYMKSLSLSFPLSFPILLFLCRGGYLQVPVSMCTHIGGHASSL